MNYSIKVDDMLLYLLKEYHSVDASEAMVFFTDRVNEMAELPANITENSRAPEIVVGGIDTRTVQRRSVKAMPSKLHNNDKFYVLRGFYPDTNLPFKMIVVYSNRVWHSNDLNRKHEPIYIKIIMGMKPHWSVLNSVDIDKYKEHASEAILLDQQPMESEKIKYKYRSFQCMRPKGMELYKEKNYEEKRKERNKVSAKLRKDKKNDK